MLAVRAEGQAVRIKVESVTLRSSTRKTTTTKENGVQMRSKPRESGQATAPFTQLQTSKCLWILARVYVCSGLCRLLGEGRETWAPEWCRLLRGWWPRHRLLVTLRGCPRSHLSHGVQPTLSIPVPSPSPSSFSFLLRQGFPHSLPIRSMFCFSFSFYYFSFPSSRLSLGRMYICSLY